MAKFKYSQNIEGDIGFDGALDLQVKINGKEATWTDDVTGAEIKVFGKNFDISEDNEDYLGSGKINSVVVTDDDGKKVVTVTDLNIKATTVMAAFEELGVSGLLYAITAGDDIVVGSKQSEYLLGGAGDDVMTGGKGSDYFEFHAQTEMVLNRKVQPEHDVITDFDWKGADADDLQYVGEYKLKGIHNGEDTRITWLDDHSTVVLEGVTKAQFKQWVDAQDDAML